MMKMTMMKLKLKNVSSFPISSFASNQALSELSPSLLMGVVEAVGDGWRRGGVIWGGRGV